MATKRIESQEKWNNLISISSTQEHLFGLKNDSSIIYTQNDLLDEMLLNSNIGILAKVRNLNSHDIIAISSSDHYGEKIVCIKEDGSVISIIEDDNIRNELDLQNAIMVSNSGTHIVGLKDDGTVVATGDNSDGQCNVQSWKLF